MFKSLAIAAALAVTAAVSTPSFAASHGNGWTHSSGSSATSGSASTASSSNQNAGVNQGITFNSPASPDHTRVDTTPSLYAAPSAFGFSQNNCGGSDTMGVGWTGFVFGGSKSKEMFDCNVRADTIILYQLGMKEAAALRMACFGSDLTRKAYEASGGECPKSATAKGIDGAPVRPDFQKPVAAVAPQAQRPVAIAPIAPAPQNGRPVIASSQPSNTVQTVPTGNGQVQRGHINPDGSITWQ